MVVKNKLILIGAAAILAMIHILWEHFNGGVVTHYPLADASNPGITNYWGLLTLPALTWIMLIIAENRRSKESSVQLTEKKIVLRKTNFLGGLAFGLLASLFWELGQENILQYVMLLPWVSALFVRIYFPETTLGFVIGMTYTFGGILPIAFSIVIQTIGFFIYLIFCRGGKWLFTKVSK